MLLAIDIGNTRIKAAVFKDDRLLSAFAFEKGHAQKRFSEIISGHPEIDVIVSSSVALIDANFIIDGISHFEVTRNIRFPFKNFYQTPDTLGIDRMVLSAGAVLSYPRANRLVIDAGTCITYDFINANDEYLGGAISPGLNLRYKSMNDYTARLPLLSPAIPSAFIGRTTSESIHAGVVSGVVYEIDGFINSYKMLGGNFIIILTGGDAEFLAAQLKNTIFASPNFLLESLNALYQYNHE